MKLRPFELALVVGFVVLMIAALFLFRGGSWTGDDEPTGPRLAAPVTIWGTMPKSAVDSLIARLDAQNENLGTIRYSEIAPRGFDQALTEAIAEGRGPDVVIVSHERMVENIRKLQAFSSDTISAIALEQQFIDSVSVWRGRSGWYGLPLAIDPLMLYSNRRLLTQRNFLSPPQTWETLLNQQFPELIERDFSRSVQRAVLAMGETTNVTNVHGILSTLAFQAGSQGVALTSRGYEIRLDDSRSNGEPFTEGVQFFMRFSNSSNSFYSWNRSLPNDRTEFIREDLAFYFGYASEASDIQRQNPNLDFSVSEVPQGAAAENRRAYGRVYAAGLLRSSRNPRDAATVVNLLYSNGERLARLAGMAPLTTSALSAGSNDPIRNAVYRTAPIAQAWANPEIARTERLYEAMVSDINAQRESVDSAVSNFLRSLESQY